MDDRQSKRLLDLLYYKLEGEGTSLFALMDGAREPRVLEAIVQSGLDHMCLFPGDAEPALKAVAPYTVRMMYGSLACERLIREAWGKGWGMFVASQLGLRMLTAHLRKLLRVQTEDHRSLFFRYYDPRVMRVFLPTCDPDQLLQIFGSIQRLDMEAEDSGQLTRFRGSIDKGSLVLRNWVYSLSDSDNAADDQGPKRR